MWVWQKASPWQGDPTTLVTRDDVRGFGPLESRREIPLIDLPLHRGTLILASKLAGERDKYQV